MIWQANLFANGVRLCYDSRPLNLPNLTTGHSGCIIISYASCIKSDLSGPRKFKVKWSQSYNYGNQGYYLDGCLARALSEVPNDTHAGDSQSLASVKCTNFLIFFWKNTYASNTNKHSSKWYLRLHMDLAHIQLESDDLKIPILEVFQRIHSGNISLWHLNCLSNHN